MFDVLLATAIAFVITYLAIPVIIQVAELKKLYDIPDERKIHTTPIPSLGGLGIFGGFILAALLTIPFGQSAEFQYFMAAAFVIFFLGVKDDILVISALKKFIGQLIAAFIIIYKGGIQIKSMHGFLGIYDMPEYFSLAFTYLTVIVIINSFNLIDGVNGLAGSLGLFTATIFGIYFFMIDMPAYAVMSFALAGSLIAFLIFNYTPAKIFMGDTGSLLLGLVNAILVIKFIDVASNPAVAYPVPASPAVGFAILIVPLLDTQRVFAIRIFNRRSPFSPDRNHLHHLLLDKGLSHTSITLTCLAINIAFVAMAWFARDLNATVLLGAMLLLAFGGLAVIYYTRPKQKLFVSSKGSNGAAIHSSKSKLVSLAKEAAVEQN
jgi:UDP-N-acetylmuramyl pentapeptide phosphotransferase/UDP-N-acetylglucosamine-1-phosphate transferase